MLMMRNNTAVAANRILYDLNVCQEPIDIKYIIGRFGISVMHEPNLGLPCALDLLGNGPVIRCRTIDGCVGRFSIAHGFGHFVLSHGTLTCHENFLGDANSTDPLQRMEWITNEFALDLLAPLWIVERLAFEFGPDAALIAQALDLSVGMVNGRLAKLAGM